MTSCECATLANFLQAAPLSDYLTVLKNEQTARIVMRDTSLYVFLGTIFAVYAAEGQAGSNAALVELVRTSATGLSAIMLSIYLSNDYYVSKIGEFVAKDPKAADFKRWEAFHREGWRHHAQKFFRTLIVLALFGGWAIYQALPVILAGAPLARNAAIAFTTLVGLELIVFLTLALKISTNKSAKAAASPRQVRAAAAAEQAAVRPQAAPDNTPPPQ